MREEREKKRRRVNKVFSFDFFLDFSVVTCGSYSRVYSSSHAVVVDAYYHVIT